MAHGSAMKMTSSVSDLGSYYKQFPTGLGHIKVPMSSRRTASAALALYSACRPAASWMQRIAIACVGLFGPRVLPGRSVSWTPPMSNEVWRALMDTWQHDFGSIDDIAIYERRRSARRGLALLLFREGTSVAFVKLRQGDDTVARREYDAMHTVWEFRPRTFSIPEPIGLGSLSGWSYLATGTLSSPEHRVPRDPPLREILAEIGAALRPLPRAPETPDHWLPMHGDFTPWNLRELPGQALVLYDWEDAGWGPPHADDVLYRASCAALRGALPGVHEGKEAVRYWYQKVSLRSGSDSRDRRLSETLSIVLRNMQGECGELA